MAAFQLLRTTVRKFPGWLALNVTLGCTSAWLNGTSMALVVPLILEMLGQNLALEGMPKVFDSIREYLNGFPGGRTLVTGGLLVMIIGLKCLLSYLAHLASLLFSRLCMADLRDRALRGLLQADVSYFLTVKPADLVAIICSQVEQTSNMLVVISQLISAVLTVMVFVLFMLLLSPGLTAIAFLLFLVAAVTNNVIIQKSAILSRQSINQSNKLVGALYETLGGIRLVKASTAEVREQDKLLRLSRSYLETSFRAGAGTGAVHPLTEFTGMLAIVAIVMLGKSFVPDQGAGMSAILLTFLFLLFRMLTQVSLINSKRNEFALVWPHVESLSTFLMKKDKTLLLNGTDVYSRLKDGIHFKSVSFKYGAEAKPVLFDVSFFIPKGTSLALVGGSGAGKTTIADLLSRCYDPDSGSICIDGKNLQEFELSSLRSNIAVVSQDPFLFNDTIGYNIRYSRPDAPEDEVLEAARRAHVLDFVEKLPLGFDSPVGERGAFLSAGEKQRISIARALLTDPDILVLDEATSALDSLSEQIVQQALVELMCGRTTLMIAHRLSTVRACEQIAVLKHGRVVEIGSHTELLAQNGLYKRMCEAGSIQLQRRSDEV